MPPLQRLTTAATAATNSLFSIYDDLTVTTNGVQPVDTIDTHTLTLMCISLSFATISVIAAQFTLYWFVRMRRGFRQDMIMLLIQSDMSKALWLVISPLVYFITKKPLSSHRAFCQVSGFFLSASIEASDIAVLLIATHTILFIIKGRHTATNFGLQPYRRIAYTVWATLPIILAAVVPITGGSFVDSGAYCYLPMEPPWYRIALAWTPRYAVLSFIVVTYTALYFYVHIHFRRFGRDHRSADTINSGSARSLTHQHLNRRWMNRSISLTSDLTTHPTHTSMSKNCPPKSRQYSDASTQSTLKVGDGTDLPSVPERVVRRNSIAWNHINFEHDRPTTTASISPHTEIAPHKPPTDLPTPSSDEIATHGDTLANTVRAASVPIPEPAHTAGSSDIESPSHIRQSSRRIRRQKRSYPRGSKTLSEYSIKSMIAALRPATTPLNPSDEERGAAGKEEEHPTSAGPLSVHLPREDSEEAMRRSRDQMQRQLRLLFVYPLIYLLTWIAPFVAHAYRYDAAFRKVARGIDTDSSFLVTTAANYNSGNITATSSPIAAIATHNILLAAARSITTTPSPSSLLSPRSSPLDVVPYEPLALRIAAVISLCIGAAVDCAFFSAWERPWKHLSGGFWENVARHLHLHRLCGRRNHPRGFSGRSRDERVVDERVARTRRDREREMGLELRSNMAAAGGGRSSSSTAGGGSARTSHGGGGGDGGDGDGEGGSSGSRRREWWDMMDEAAL